MNGPFLRDKARILRKSLRILPLLLPFSIAQAEPGWYIFTRDDGCTDIQILARKLKLPRNPTSPDDFAQMMRDRGEQVSVGPSPWFPPGIEVRFGPERSLTFLSAEACRAAKGQSR